MIHTLLVTIVLEGAIVSAYASWRRKPPGSLLLTGLWANLFTQSFLWTVLNLFFADYLLTLTVAEIAIWLVEAVLVSCVPSNRLQIREALFLSLCMNLTSFVAGWFLPI